MLCRNVKTEMSRSFKPPQQFVQASQARVAKLKELRDNGASSPNAAPNSPSVSVSGVNTNSITSSNGSNTNSLPVPIPDSKTTSASGVSFSPDTALASLSLSPSRTRFSKTALQVEKLRVQREERRQKQSVIRERRESMTDSEVHVMQYRQTIDAFRIQFAKQQGALKIRLNSTQKVQTKAPRIRVCVRKRPLNNNEATLDNFDIVTTCSDDHPFAQIYLHEPKTKLDMSRVINTHKFRFDHVFDESATNQQVYDTTTRPLVKSFLKGGKVTLFAYGQTGSGKTHTIFGTRENPGIFECACRGFFTPNLAVDKKLHVAFYEIYSGRIYDLLSDRLKVALLEDAQGACHITGHREVCVASFEELIATVKLGSDFRTTGSTEANAQSSRSHAIIQMSLRNSDGSLFGQFFMVDLAGSERGVDTGNIDRQARLEGSEINKSLLALKECIRALHQRQIKASKIHVPFRASKLTQVLRDAFIGKRSQTVMIATLSPGSNSSEHSLNTLRYADRVKEINSDVLANVPEHDKEDLESLPSPNEAQVDFPEFEEVDDEIECAFSDEDYGDDDPETIDDLSTHMDAIYGSSDILEQEDAIVKYCFLNLVSIYHRLQSLVQSVARNVSSSLRLLLRIIAFRHTLMDYQIFWINE